jgi:predicted negative regulator of RcsB-dependent stress response
MSNLDLEEQEQLAELKSWWRQHGNQVVMAITVVLMAFAAWNGWTWYQRNQAAQAAPLYAELQKAARAGDAKAARDTAGTILENYPRTGYAAMAALLSAKVHFQAGDLKTARAQLQWASDNARSEELKSVARLRLANVMIDEGALDEAVKVLASATPDAFAAAFAATRGDVLALQKKNTEARAAYKVALEKREGLDPTLRDVVQLKLDALGDS